MLIESSKVDDAASGLASPYEVVRSGMTTWT